MHVRRLGRADLPAVCALLDRSWAYDRFRLALVGEKLHGDPSGEAAEAFGLDAEGALAGFMAVVARGEAGWIKLGAVAPGHARRGVLAGLLVRAERWAARRGAHSMRLMDHPGNYWTPGLDLRYAEALEALGRLGYTFAGENRNLACPTRPRGRPPCVPARVRVRRAAGRDREALLALAASFHPAWSWEVGRALDDAPPSVHLAEAGGRIVAFAAHDGNNKGTGAFGPAGTLRAWRGRGLGELLLRACLGDVARRGRRLATIPWASRTALYERLGAVESGRYRVLVKPLCERARQARERRERGP